MQPAIVLLCAWSRAGSCMAQLKNSEILPFKFGLRRPTYYLQEFGQFHGLTLTTCPRSLQLLPEEQPGELQVFEHS